MINAAKRLTTLRHDWTGCERCALAKLRTSSRICFGAGSHDADVLIVFDKPSADDMHCGFPGTNDDVSELLDVLLDAGGLDARRTFRTTVVACRPYSVIPATEEDDERVQDRAPDKEEIQACRPRLRETIYIVDPYIILAMGEVAWKALVATRDREKNNTIAQAQKKLFRTHIPGRTTTLTYPVMATVSPLQMLTNPSAASHGPTATTAQAIGRAVKYLDFLQRQETA